jgi:hypothetical protein
MISTEKLFHKSQMIRPEEKYGEVPRECLLSACTWSDESRKN